MSKANILKKIMIERKRQDRKWGEQNHHPIFWASILGEEFGELCEAINETVFSNPGKKHLGGNKNIAKEATEVAAVAIALLECIERGKYGSSK